MDDQKLQEASIGALSIAKMNFSALNDKIGPALYEFSKKIENHIKTLVSLRLDLENIFVRVK